MLELAYFNQAELYDCLKHVVTNKDLYFYLMYPNKFFNFRIDNNDSTSIQFVSKTQTGEIIGFFSAYINSSHDYIENLDFINFSGRPSIIFSRDTKLFFDEIFINRKFRKITFYAIAQNPAVKMYRKLIKKLGGQEVGILKENKKLTDGQYYDEVIFEIFREGYIAAKK